MTVTKDLGVHIDCYLNITKGCRTLADVLLQSCRFLVGVKSG